MSPDGRIDLSPALAACPHCGGGLYVVASPDHPPRKGCGPCGWEAAVDVSLYCPPGTLYVLRGGRIVSGSHRRRK